MPSRRRVVMFYFVLVAGTLFLALVLGEVYVRLFSEDGYITPEILGSRSPKYEPAVFAYHVLARQRDSLRLSTGATVEINAKGYRGPEFEREKPAGTIRIMVYGGSAAFDPGESRGQDWPQRVERLLREAGFAGVEVINAGIPGHNSADSLGRFFAEGHLFEPDYVLLYNAWNDIKFFKTDEPLLRWRKPYAKADDPRTHYQGLLDKVMCETSQLYVRLRHHYYLWKLKIGVEGALPGDHDTNRVEQTALRQYRLNAELFVDTARNIGAVPVLMTQARLVAPENTPEQREKIRYDYQGMDHDTLVRAFEIVDEILEDVAASKEVPLVDASAAITGIDRFYYDHVHLTSEGSAELARVTATELEPLLTANAGHSPSP